MVVSPRPCAKPRHECAPNEDWDAQFSENVKIVQHAPTHGPQKLLLVTQILKKEKMNRLNLIQAHYFYCYLHCCCLSNTSFIIIIHWNFFGTYFFIRVNMFEYQTPIIFLVY